MTSRNSQCSNCGHLFSDDNPYFSEDFAGYYSRRPAFALRWCYHCAYVSSYVQPWFLKIIRLPRFWVIRLLGLRVKGSLPIRNVDSEPLWETDDREIGGFAGAHLMRMVWQCLNARIDLEYGELESKEQVVHRALEKLPPREVAVMVYVTANSRDIVPVKRQIEEGAYIKESIPISTFEHWISSSSEKEAAKETLERLKAFREK